MLAKTEQKRSGVLYTDGACPGNHGLQPGGWAYYLVITNPFAQRQDSGHLVKTTNNMAELIAIREGLKAVPPGTTLIVATDSQCCARWLDGNLANGQYRGSTYKPRKQHIYSLVMQIHCLVQELYLDIEWQWIPALVAEKQAWCDQQAKLQSHCTS